MIKVVLDTNVLVSALWTANGNPKRILDMVGKNEIKPCYDYRLIAEYEYVLNRPKFKFPIRDISGVIARIKAKGMAVTAAESTISFVDETDRAFYDVAVSCGAYLVTGNKKHYPNEQFILSPVEFLELFEK